MPINCAGRRALMPLLLGAALWLSTSASTAQTLSGDALVEALQQGGYVIVMRNAQSREERPEEGQEAPGNVRLEREITEYGQGQMAAMSYVFRELDLPAGQVFTSPAYRSVQTANYFGFGERTAVDALAAVDGNPSWLAGRVTQAPSPGHNAVIVAGGAFIAESLGELGAGLEPAETLIFRPGGEEPELVARLTVEQWSGLAVN